MRDTGDWVRRAQAGDEAAFDRLVRELRDPIYHLALSRTGDPHEAADVAQEAFIKAFRGLHGLREPERFAAWLRTIAMNEAREAMRRRARRDRLAASAEPRRLDRVATDDQPTPLELGETWRALIARVDEPSREIIVLRFVSGLSYAEIAELLDISVDLVGVRLLRAKRALRRALTPTGERERATE